MCQSTWIYAKLRCCLIRQSSIGNSTLLSSNHLSLLRSYRNLREMTPILCLNFYLKVFFPLFIVMACRMFWTDLFANLWQHAELPNLKSDALKHGYLGPMPSTVLPCPVYFTVNICLDHALLKRLDATRRD